MRDIYNAFAGVDFEMPEMPGLSTSEAPTIPVSTGKDMMTRFNNRMIMGEPLVDAIVGALDDASGGKGAGLISPKLLTNVLMDSSLGAFQGYSVANVIGGIFSLDPSTRNKLNTIGAVGGAIRKAGLVR
jgi:hypothetical protein